MKLLLCRYGELQGLNKKETADKFGADKVHEWRRSYDIPPPNGESLEMCAERAVKYFVENVRPVTYYPAFYVLLCEIQTNCTSFSSLKSLLLSNFYGGCNMVAGRPRARSWKECHDCSSWKFVARYHHVFG